MLVGLAGCTGVDVVSILKKMRVEFDDLDIKVEAEATEDSPSVYTAMHIIYTFKGKELELELLQANGLGNPILVKVHDVAR